jgi:hypothetical protein
MLKLVDGVIIARSSIAMVLPLEDVSNKLQAFCTRSNFFSDCARTEEHH